MTYEIADSKVLWKGRPVTRADASSFCTLADIVGADAATVYVLGKPFAADRKTFEVLNDGYARDGATVWRIMATKLKPMKADVASFEVLGPDHARDAKCMYYRDKRMQLTKGVPPDAVQPMTGAFSTDGVSLYHNARRIPKTDKNGLDWHTARLRPLTPDDGINVPQAAVGVGSEVWLLCQRALTPPLTRLDGADFPSLAPVSPRLWRAGTNYLSDGTRVWYKGGPVDGARGQDARAWGTDVLEDGGGLWIGPQRFHLAAADCAIGAELDRFQLLHASDGLYEVAYRGQVSKVADAQPAPAAPADAVLTDWLRKVVRQCHSYYLSIELGDWQSAELLAQNRPWSKTRPGTKPLVEAPDCAVSARLEGDQIIAQGGGLTAPVQDRLCGWVRLVQRICMRLMGKDGAYWPIVTLNGYPEGSELGASLALSYPQELFDTASACFDAAPEDAKDMLHPAWAKLRWLKDPDDTMAALARMPLGLVASAQYQRHPYGYIDATTHLAGVRALIAQGHLADPDWRIRLEYAQLLHSLVWATGKPTLVMSEIMEVFETVTSAETHPMVIETYASMLYVMSEVCERVMRRPTKGEDVTEVYPWVLRQAIDWGVTPDVCRARLHKT